MAEQDGQEKTEAPTEKKREDARDEGQVVFSKEISSTALLAIITLFFYMMGPYILETGQAFFIESFKDLSHPDLNLGDLYQMFLNIAKITLPIVAPLFVIVIVVAVMASVFQVGFHLTFKPLMPKFQKISPMQGVKRWFSSKTFVDLGTSLLKMLIIGYVGYLTFRHELEQLMMLAITPTSEIIAYNFSVILTVMGKIMLASVAIAAIDYLYQRWHHEQELKMTKQETKEEMKQSEGDPLLKSRIRQIQREMSRARVAQEVPKADAIVVNPTHFAVALRYDRTTMLAPQVTAKGIDYLALRMRAIAKENNVPVVERPALARELYHSVEIGQAIPDHFYKAVAEILAYVYRLKRRR